MDVHLDCFLKNRRRHVHSAILDRVVILLAYFAVRVSALAPQPNLVIMIDEKLSPLMCY